jgi:xanthosine utilization system XapX-like protein
MRFRVATAALVVGAGIADAAGAHAQAYYLLVAAVPAAAIAALTALGAVLDRTAAAPTDRVLAILSGLVLPFLLLATAVRAPLASEVSPPAIAITGLVGCLAVLSLQAVVVAAALLERSRHSGSAAAASRARSINGWTKTNEPTVTPSEAATATTSNGSRAGEPPATAGRSRGSGRVHIASATRR